MSRKTSKMSNFTSAFDGNCGVLVNVKVPHSALFNGQCMCMSYCHLSPWIVLNFENFENFESFENFPGMYSTIDKKNALIKKTSASSEKMNSNNLHLPVSVVGMPCRLTVIGMMTSNRLRGRGDDVKYLGLRIGINGIKDWDRD